MPNTIVDRRDKLGKRAIAYIDALPSAGTGERNNSVFRLAGNLRAINEGGERLTDGDIMGLVRRWNHRNEDPLPDDELSSVIASSAINGTPRASKPNRPLPVGSLTNGSDPNNRSSIRPDLVRMSEIEPREIVWLRENRFPAGQISLIVGTPGFGKSFVTCDMAARINVGASWPDGTPCEQGSVIICNVEDDLHSTVRPRLDAAGADVAKVYVLKGSVYRDCDGKESEVIFTLQDLPVLEEAIEMVPDCRLIFIDPIGSFLSGKTDAHRDNEVRGVLAPLAKLAEGLERLLLSSRTIQNRKVVMRMITS